MEKVKRDEEEDFVSYIVTGTDVRGRRFRICTISLRYALGINLWRGTVWGVDANNKRRKLRSVRN